MHILLTRPQAASEELAEQLGSAAGGEHICHIAPVIEIEFLQSDCDFAETSVVVVTSSNAVRAAENLAQSDLAKQLPLFCVGARTAQLARTFGWRKVAGVGQSIADLRDILDRRVTKGPAIYLAGENRAGELDAKIVEVYRARAVEALSPEFWSSFRAPVAQGGIEAVTLFSARTAAIFLALIAAEKLDDILRKKVIYCLSEAIAEPVRAVGCENVLVPDEPTRTAMVELING